MGWNWQDQQKILSCQKFRAVFRWCAFTEKIMNFVFCNLSNGYKIRNGNKAFNIFYLLINVVYYSKVQMAVPREYLCILLDAIYAAFFKSQAYFNMRHGTCGLVRQRYRLALNFFLNYRYFMLQHSLQIKKQSSRLIK